jgi:hypothetical protein
VAETSNIATMAEILSKDIFKWFKWTQTGSMDTNNTCVIDEHSKKEHPSDIVFHYEDPYSDNRIYLNFDLKSYGESTLSSKNFTNELNSLGMSIECAEQSPDWKENYVVHQEGHEIIGVLFIYNHDSKSDIKKTDIFKKINMDNLKIKKGQKLIVFGTEDIDYLKTVANDISSMKSNEIFHRFDDYSFHYPDLKLKRRHIDWPCAASIEYLTAPWMLMKYKNKSDISEYVVYYRERGDSVDEFVYLIDVLSAYQLIGVDKKITVRLYNCNPKAAIYFRKATEQYLQSWGMEDSKEKALKNITASSINELLTINFNQQEIGMGIRGWKDE